MLKLDASDLQRIAISAMGAMILSTAAIIGSVGQARAEQPVETLVQPAVARVAVSFDRDGSFESVRLIRSTGDRRLDAEALGIARAVSYPALPDGLRRIGRTVSMQLDFEPPCSPADAAVARWTVHTPSRAVLPMA